MSKTKERLDRLLIERGLVSTRSKGQARIMAGEVRVDGEVVSKAGTLVALEAEITVDKPSLYVSRGGFKLADAISTYCIGVEQKICADVGACTGGFTDVLLKGGAARVYSIDVGYGQLDWNLRQDPRVVVMERTNARYLHDLPEKIDFVCIDVSFISLKLILPSVKLWLAPDAQLVALVKPQFEAGRHRVGKGGIVRDAMVHEDVLRDLLQWSEQQELYPMGLKRSPIEGAKGNREFLMWLGLVKKSGFTVDSEIESALG